jgi:hypothetical protein
MRRSSMIGLTLLWVSAAVWAQTPPVSTAAAVAKAEAAPADPAAAIARLESSVPQPKPSDVASVDAIMVAIYQSISGPAGDRTLDRFRSLMLPNARLTSSIVDEHGHASVKQWSVDEFVAEVRPVFATNAFYESALVNRVQRFGNMAQVFTSYASRSEPKGEPFQRGINSMQLMYDGKRWWVVSILWDIERPGNALPKAMQH